MAQAIKPHLHEKEYTVVGLLFNILPIASTPITLYKKILPQQNEILVEGWIPFPLSDVNIK